jgi:hypothetical protein
VVVKFVPRTSIHEPEANTVLVPQPSEAFASVMEAVGVSADNSDPAKPLSKIERVFGACAKTDTLTNNKEAARQEEFINVTIGLD